MADNASINIGHINMRDFMVENRNSGVNSSIGDHSRAKAVIENKLIEQNEQDQNSGE